MLHDDVGARATFGTLLLVDGVDARNGDTGLVSDVEHVLSLDRTNQPSILDDKVLPDANHSLTWEVLWPQLVLSLNLGG